MFTIVDFSKWYYHIEFKEASSFPTTFKNPFGRFRFTRMPLRLNVAEDVIKCNLDSVFSNLDFCTSIADDIIKQGEQWDGSDHDKHFTKLLQVTWKHNLKLNIRTLQDKIKHVSFFGTTFTFDGHKPGNEKVQAINKMPQVTNVKGLQCFL